MTRDEPNTGGGGLDLTIDRRAEVPIGVQLAWALRARIHDGRLATGQRLPGLRDLAQALKINANTVRAVYQRLEQEGMIESQQGSGTYVTATAHERSAAGAIAASAAQEARRTGIDPREVAAALYVEPEHQPAPPRRAAEGRRVLRIQIATLEQLLVKIEAEHPELVPVARAAVPPQRALPDSGPRLLDMEELEQTQTHLIRRLAALQAALDEHAQQGRGGSAEQAAEQALEPATETETEAETATVPKRAARRRRPPRPAPA
ncbi:MAG TPA: GntR family transcriptional regulator [Solirubrobacteraceae bacterium]|nr:GntR family transcriptional regulator [Solirubrobacteraceae bacterium]